MVVSAHGADTILLGIAWVGRKLLFYKVLLIIAIMAGAAHANAAGVTNANLAIIVNDNDPQSVAVADYYQKARRIPDEHVVHLSFDHNKSSLSAATFNRLKAQVESKVPDQVQAYSLTWTKPYKVECMSITSAFALGVDRKYCAQGCKPTQSVAYYNSTSERP